MRQFTFAQMVAGAVEAGVAGDLEQTGQWGQVCAAASYSDVLLQGAQPALEGRLNGQPVWQSSVTAWVVVDGAAVPLTMHMGYSEGGCVALYRGKLHSWPTMRDPVQVPEEIWAALQVSVWCAPDE